MKILEKKIIYSFILCMLEQSIIARHEKNDYLQELYDTVIEQEPLKIDYKKIINPKEIGLSNPEALKINPMSLTHEQKVEHYKKYKELRDIFNRHAYGLLDGKIFTSEQALNFFNMNIHEQQEQMIKWLKDHNVHQNNQLKEASKKYQKEIRTFKGSIQYETLKKVRKLQKEIANRDDQINHIEKQLAKKNLSTIETQQKHQEIHRLTEQNNIDNQNIQTQLHMILEKLDDIDNDFKKNCEKIIQDYQAKNYEILGTVNNIVSSQNQAFRLKTSDKDLSKMETIKLESKQNSKINAALTDSDSAILSESKTTLANNPILDTIIQRHEKEILKTKKNNPEYKILKDELSHLMSARRLRDIRGTSIN